MTAGDQPAFENVTKQVVAKGLQSPEGPSFDRSGVLHFVDWDARSVYRLDEAGNLKEFVSTGGVPTGSKFHKNGNLYVADGDLGILIVEPNGKMRVAASHWKGRKFRGPNDLVFAPNGDLYFTDPKDSDSEHPIGNVFILRRSGEVELFAAGFQFPNGTVFSDDGRTLYMAETLPNHILAFELDTQGYEKSRRVYAKLEGELGPDGMAFGKDGNLYVAHFGKGAVAVIDPHGEVIAELDLNGKNPTNVAFWGGALYVTEVQRGQVLRLNLGVEGQTLYGLS
jgi:gluconolactonase